MCSGQPDMVYGVGSTAGRVGELDEVDKDISIQKATVSNHVNIWFRFWRLLGHFHILHFLLLPD